MSMENLNYENEIWRDIPEYEGLYQASNLGRIRNIKRNKCLKLVKHHKGYLIVELFKNGCGKQFNVHRLVAKAFIPNPNNLPQVNHKDENKLNNCVDNLEWCSADYNTNYGNRNKKVSIKMTNGKLSKPLLQLTLDDKIVNEWPSAMEVQRKTNFKQSFISDVCKGKYKQAYGFKWQYK